MLNGTNVHFETPKVPVVFVLGGPGSGKVTHCDNLAQDEHRIVHINMTDLLQQYTIGNDMQDFCQLSSITVTEVLMLEMKMAPNSKGYLVSGYPRNMRDVVEYSDKIQKLTGVVLIAWREKVLERQINYGAKLGQIVMSLARMELKNFFKNVIPVAEYFDHSDFLVTINGERQPDEVYEEFKTVILKMFHKEECQPVRSSYTSTEMPTAVVTDSANLQRPKTHVVRVASPSHNSLTSPLQNWPKIIWIIGGPGSNKAILCDQAASVTGWVHISLGRLLRSTADVPSTKHSQDVKKIKECIVAGELVPLEIILKIVESYIAANANALGILLDGYPRNMQQAIEFEEKFGQKPTLILLDCSKLQLGRGRLDDSVTAFRRRLEIFRQFSLPMLRSLDSVGRLTIVDGDTDASAVREDFLSVIQQHVEYLSEMETNQTNANDTALNSKTDQMNNNGNIPNIHRNHITQLNSSKNRNLIHINEERLFKLPNDVDNAKKLINGLISTAKVKAVTDENESVNRQTQENHNSYGEINHM
ncbi:adenylate kinase isoenzyme 5 isoform X2 [Agrilus planipennis]|nr:adenylate kinase isoenzyme 5 isoform X2 [Agrilus planipennis]